MTIEEWLKEYKDTDNEDAKKLVELVEKFSSVHENSNSDNSVLGDIRDSNLELQYQAFLSDPRRI